MKKRIVTLVIFSIAMAYVEAIVVVYLRRLVPLEIWNKITSYQELTFLIRDVGIMWSEQTRELATIVMLTGVAFLFGKNRRQRRAGFLIAFGIWDIFYYIFLYVWLRWPPHLFSQDVLFLIPVPWVAPVAVPVFISCVMIFLGSWMLAKVKS